MCPLGFFVAIVPLWQDMQLPGATPAWLYEAGVQPVVRWQLSHGAVVGTCRSGFAVAPMRLPAM
jgi:hypothetical protein